MTACGASRGWFIHLAGLEKYVMGIVLVEAFRISSASCKHGFAVPAAVIGTECPFKRVIRSVWLV